MKIPIKMRAALYKAPGQPLELAETEIPTPGEGEILIKVAATGVCHSDLHILDVDFGPRCENPHGLSPGDPVVISWIIPCGKCYWCVRGQENYCPYAAARMPGLVGLNGGHAEYMSVPETAVFPIPKEVDVHTAAVISCAYGTAYRALKEAAVGPGTSLVVIGVGGVGLAAVELASALGARPIIAVDVRKHVLGATHLINATNGDPLSKIRDILPQGADVVYETKPNPDLKLAVEIVRRGGTIVVTGLGTSTIEIPANHIVMNGIRIIGSLGYKPRTDIPELLTLAASGKIKPQRLISHKYAPNEINEAYKNLRIGLHHRAIIIWNTK